MTGLYRAPALEGGRFRRFAGSWQVGVLATIQSGAPFTVVSAANTTNAFSARSLRPRLLRDPRPGPGERTLARRFDPLAFAAPAPFTFGDSPRAGLRGDRLQTVDLTLFREFVLSERYKFDLRGEF